MKKYSFFLAAAVLLAGCSKSENDSQLVEPSFRAGIVAVPTKASSTTAMADGVKASILIFEKDADVALATPVQSQVYTSDAAGNLTGTAISVVNKTYDFYSVSENTADTPLSFTAATAAVSNGKDYLWVKKQQAVTSSSKQVDLVYARSAVKLTVVLAGAGMDLSNTAMQFTPSDDASASMSLATGKISVAAAKKANKTAMAMTANAGTFIMVPLAASIDLDVEITSDVKISGSSDAAVTKTYQATIPAPASGFEAGKEYKYTATLSGSTVIFSGAQITDWISGADDSIDANEKP